MVAELRKFEEEYAIPRPSGTYPEGLMGASRDRGVPLSAEARILEYQNSPEYRARQAELAEAARKREIAEAQALFDSVRQRTATAAPATAIADVAEVADDQAVQVERVVGTV